MTYGELKNKLENPILFQSIMNLVKDPTLGNSRKGQIEGLLFRMITKKTWDCVDDTENI